MLLMRTIDVCLDADVSGFVGGSGTSVDAVHTGPSQMTMDTDETVKGYGSDSTVFSLALYDYDKNKEMATRNLVPPHRIPSYHVYALPVHISEAVVPFKQYLDDCFPKTDTFPWQIQLCHCHPNIKEESRIARTSISLVASPSVIKLDFIIGVLAITVSAISVGRSWKAV
ncbi:hypothetical protein NQZ79_g7115 [Umbelopsis isabellina]|nr:hypothetical protein NQZ79_g7115 [Umbelopsis isabellina]